MIDKDEDWSHLHLRMKELKTHNDKARRIKTAESLMVWILVIGVLTAITTFVLI
jgi:hypothetical protein|tara:strand:+ start:292 stop:453 length:162 start_codon:yes stop_codon:yes gene_type:complete